MDLTADGRLATLARSQDGLFTRTQALASGLRGRVVDRRVADGQLVEHHPGVYGAAVDPSSLARRERAALLAVGPDALLSHDNAAARWGMDVPTPEGVWLTVGYARRHPRLTGVDVMRSRHLEGVRRVRHGVPLTAPARTWVDLGRTRTADELESALARGLQRSTFTLAEVARVLAVAHNRAGTGLVREVLPRYLPEWESVLGARFAALMLEAGIDLLPGVPVDQGGRRIALLDFADPARRIAFEVDGWHYHGSKVQQQRDRLRDRTLLALGWVTVRFTTEDILLRPEQVVADVRAVLLARAA